MIRRPPRSTRLTHSFPTRRSSDLVPVEAISPDMPASCCIDQLGIDPHTVRHSSGTTLQHIFDAQRSEEHTSELQSLMRISYAVFCLKKKTKKKRNVTKTTKCNTSTTDKHIKDIKI